jgi:hypothetical protein
MSQLKQMGDRSEEWDRRLDWLYSQVGPSGALEGCTRVWLRCSSTCGCLR